MTESQKKVRRLTRDGVLYAIGLLGIIAEWARFGTERPFLLAVFAGMVGLPSFIPKNDPPSKGTNNDH